MMQAKGKEVYVWMELLTTDDAAKLLKTSKRSFIKLLKNKTIVAFKHGNLWRIEKKDLESYIIQKKKEQQK